MEATLIRLYRQKKDPTILSKAVAKGWLTQERANEIIAEFEGEVK